MKIIKSKSSFLSPVNIILYTAFVIAVCACMFSWFSISYAQTSVPSVTLSVDNRSSVQITNGQSVTLRWEVYNVSNCSINNGVGSIPSSELPTGSRVVTPSSGQQTNYTMTCQGGSSAVSVIARPTVSLSANPVTVVLGANGNGNTTLNWSTQNVTQCTEIRQVQTGSRSATVIPITQPGTSGAQSVTISGTTRFTIYCVNNLLNTSVNRTITVQAGGTESNPQITNFIANPNPATWDPVWSAARVRVQHTAQFATECKRKAVNEQGQEIYIGPWTAGSKSLTTYNIILSIPETVTLTLECGRPMDNKWTSATLRVVVNKESGAQAIPPTATIVAPDSISITDGVSGSVSVTVAQRSTGVSSCVYRAFNSSNQAITLNGWTNLHHHASLNSSTQIRLRDTVKLEMDCGRLGDNLRATDSHTITVNRAPVATLPTVEIMAEPLPAIGTVPQARISWVSQNASNCPVRTVTFNGNTSTFSTNYSTNGTTNVPVYGPSIFKVTCIQNGTNAEASDEVSVFIQNGDVVVINDSVTVDIDEENETEDPVDPVDEEFPETTSMNLEARPSIVRKGDSTELFWSAHPELECSLESNGEVVPGFIESRTGSVQSGVIAISEVIAERTFDLICNGGEESPKSVSATVRVLPEMQES